MANDVARRMSFEGGPGRDVSSYYAPRPAMAVSAVGGVEQRDFAGRERAVEGGRVGDVQAVPVGHGVEGGSARISPRPAVEDVVSPVSSTEGRAHESIAGPAPQSPKGKGREVVAEPAGSGSAPQLPEIAVVR